MLRPSPQELQQHDHGSHHDVSADVIERIDSLASAEASYDVTPRPLTPGACLVHVGDAID